MPQYSLVRQPVGVHSFVEGFKPSRRSDPVGVSEARVLAMCEYLERQGDPEEAESLLDRYLELSGRA